MMPSTSVQISMASAFSAPPTSAPVKSEPPRPSVVVMPASLDAMNPPITGTLPCATSGRSFSGARFSMMSSSGAAFWNSRVGDDDVARIHVRRVDALLAKGRRHNAAGDALAVAHDQVGDARRELENRRQAAQNLVQRVELLVDEL